MLLEPQSLLHKSVEMTRQEIREVERTGLIERQLSEVTRASIELVTVRTRKPVNAERGQYLVQRATGPAIGLRHEDVLELFSSPFDLCTHRGRDLLWPIVQVGRQALNRQVRPAIQSF